MFVLRIIDIIVKICEGGYGKRTEGKNYRLNLDGFEMLNGEVVVSISFDAVDINNAKNIKLKYEGKTVANIKGMGNI